MLCYVCLFTPERYKGAVEVSAKIVGLASSQLKKKITSSNCFILYFLKIRCNIMKPCFPFLSLEAWCGSKDELVRRLYHRLAFFPLLSAARGGGGRV